MAERGRGRGRGDRGGGAPASRGGDRDGRGRGGRGFEGGRGGVRGGRGGGPGPVQVFSPPDGSQPVVNQKLKSIEDQQVKQMASTTSSDTLGLEKLNIGTQFPIRPGYGTLGREILLYANFMELAPSRNLVVYRYNILFQPTNGSKRKQWRLVEQLLQTPAFAPHRSSIVTDFSKFLISAKELNNIPKTSQITHQLEEEDTPSPQADTYNVSINLEDELRVSDLMDHISSTNVGGDYDRGSMLQALNIWLGHFAKAHVGMVTPGSGKAVSLADDTPRFDLGAGLIAWRGFFSSVRIATSRLLVNVNVSHRVFWEPIRLDRLYAKHRSSHRDHVSLGGVWKNLRLQTTHLPVRRNKKGQEIPKVKTFYGFATRSDGRGEEKPPIVERPAAGPQGVKFFLRGASKTPSKKENVKKKGTAPASDEGRYISVFDYFKQTYPNFKLNPEIPVINVGDVQHPSYLPCEVCEVLPGQNVRMLLPPDQTRNMLNFAVRRPWENFDSILKDGVPTVGLVKQDNPQMGAFGIDVPCKFVTVPGRILDVPQVAYKQSRMKPSFGSWNLQDVKFIKCAALRDWAVKFILPHGQSTPPLSREGATNLIDQFTSVVKSTGIDINRPASIDVVRLSVPLGEDDPELKKAIDSAPGPRDKPRMLLMVLPSNERTLYSWVKKFGDIDCGVLTQCVIFQKLRDKGVQYHANVAMKLNLKCGGTNHVVPGLDLIEDNETMVVGADVTHPTGGDPDAPSYAGMVACIDSSLGQFLPVIRTQTGRKEMITDMGSMLKECLHRWIDPKYGKHAKLPRNILIFRDGVSDSQRQTVLDAELPLLRAACKEVYDAKEQAAHIPKLTIDIVSKRHHVRFTVTNASNADRSHNPKNGTVVDRGITEARLYNFYLQPHAALQGTARAMHHNIVHDEIFPGRKLPQGCRNTADVTQQLAHNMSYTFGRATKAVSICPPAYYADLLCDRAKDYPSMLAELQIHPVLRDTMFYI